MKNRVLLLLSAFALGCGADPQPKPADKSDPVPITAKGPEPKAGEDLAARKDASRSNIRKLATALIDGLNPGGALSTGVYAADGKTIGLSWRVAILPALKEDALYKQFKLDEPWDGPNNKKLIAKMPAIFASAGKPAGEGMTFYRSFIGGGSLMTPRGMAASGKNSLGGKWPDDIQDGTGNTALLAEAAEAVVWTKPDEIDASKGPSKLGGAFTDGFHVAFADCDARFFKTGAMTEKMFKAMISPAGDDLADYPGLPKPPTGPIGATRR